MGCKGSKSKKNAYARAAQYQKESWAAENSLSIHPKPLEWVTPPPGIITPSCLHNLLTDGFYAPFTTNPFYLLLIDCRPEGDFIKKKLLTSRSHKDFNLLSQSPEKYFSIVLYDNVPRTSAPSQWEKDPLAILYHQLKRRKLNPKVVSGGWPTIEIICKHLTVIGKGNPSSTTIVPWYPSLIMPGFLYLGHLGMANNRHLLTQLEVTHVITLTDIVPQRVLPSTNYLVVPLSEDANQFSLSGGLDLIAAMPTVLAFVNEARHLGGSVLIQCEEGFTKAAVITMAILMAERCCSLEDAFYYVRGARSSVQPNNQLLEQLLEYEFTLFGGPVSAIDELFL